MKFIGETYGAKHTLCKTALKFFKNVGIMFKFQA